MSIPQDSPFEGIGQVEVDFLGQSYVVGCIEGEEDRSVRCASSFEVSAGEVLKAVTGELDLVRTTLMAGILAHGRIEDLEHGLRSIPASDRVVRLDHNSAEFQHAEATLETLIVVVRESNSYREQDAPDQERRLSELEAGRTMLRSRWVSTTKLKAVLWGTLAYLSTKFVDVPIGEAASVAWNALKQLLGLG